MRWWSTLPLGLWLQDFLLLLHQGLGNLQSLFPGLLRHHQDNSHIWYHHRNRMDLSPHIQTLRNPQSSSQMLETHHQGSSQRQCFHSQKASAPHSPLHWVQLLLSHHPCSSHRESYHTLLHQDTPSSLAPQQVLRHQDNIHALYPCKFQCEDNLSGRVHLQVLHCLDNIQNQFPHRSLVWVLACISSSSSLTSWNLFW